MNKQTAVELALAAREYFYFSGAMYCLVGYKFLTSPDASWSWLIQDEVRRIKAAFWRAPAMLAGLLVAIFIFWWIQAIFWGVFGAIFGPYITIPLVIIAPFVSIYAGNKL